MPCWWHCRHPPPSDAQLLPRKKDLVTKGGRERTRFRDTAHLGANVIFLIQGNICSCFSFQREAGSRPRTREAPGLALALGGRVENGG